MPNSLNLLIVGKGSMLGEEDAIGRKVYSCTVRCYSLSAKVFCIKREDFMTLRKSDDSWLNILEKALWKEKRKLGNYIKNPRK